MSIWKKAISVGTSAALLASLFTAVIAAPVAASVTVTSVGSIPVGGTSASELTILFTERADPDDLTAAGSLTFTINDSTPTNTTDVVFSGTPVKSAPGSLGTVTATTAENKLTVSWTAHDALNIETIQITGLKIKAETSATPGPVSATLDGAYAGFFEEPTTATATGTILDSNKLLAGADTADVLVSSVCPFAATGGLTSNASFSDVSDSRGVNGVAAGPIPGSQTIDFAVGINAHGKDVIVTQTVSYAGCKAALGLVGAPLPGSIGVIGDSLIYNSPTQTQVNPSENNQLVADLSATERTIGFLKKDATITLTIATTGVTFSVAPNVDVSGAGLTLSGASPSGTSNVFGTLSADRKSVTWTVTAASTAVATITFDDIRYDVAAVASGTKIDVTLATSAGLVQPTSRSNAVVGRVLSVTATSPVVYIGENNQTAGQITIVETGPGFFTAGSGSNNTLALCLNSGESFASAPWAKVTAGDLKLREGDVVSPDNVVQSKATFVAGVTFACYYWTVWTASTAASTIVISGDEAGTAGVKINVPFGLGVGPVYGGVRTGEIASLSSPVTQSQATIGTRAFRTQVTVTALSQPTIPVGSNGALAGDIQIQETANGQLKANEKICVDIVPNQNWNTLYDVFLKALNTADRPVVTASNGIVVSGVEVLNGTCTNPGSTAGFVTSFSFFVQQQSITGNGKIVISNIKYATVNDAVEGPVQVNVYGFQPPQNGTPSSGTQIQFQSIISNARVGGPVTLSIGAVSALGLNPTSGYTTKTPKVQAPNKYITWKFTGGKTLANQRVNILVALRINGAWGGPQYLVSRTADANGIVTFYWKAPAGTVLNIRAQWPGNANYNKSTSPALGAHWK